MTDLVTIISTAVNDLKNRVNKFRRYGKDDVQTAYDAAPFGTDSVPVPGMIAVYAQTSNKSKKVIIGYINKQQLAKVGEHRIYSTDSDGQVKFVIWLKNDGTCEIGGSDDYFVRFSKLKEAFDELQNDVKTLKQVFTSWTPVPNDGGAALKTASATWFGTPFQKTIDPAKIDNIKTSSS